MDNHHCLAAFAPQTHAQVSNLILRPPPPCGVLHAEGSRAAESPLYSAASQQKHMQLSAHIHRQSKDKLADDE